MGNLDFLELYLKSEAPQFMSNILDRGLGGERTDRARSDIVSQVSCLLVGIIVSQSGIT